LQKGRQAIEEFKVVLSLDPQDLPALDAIGSLMFQMAGQPFNPDLFAESKSYHRRHIQIQPSDPEPYYWIGVIDWTLAFRINGQMRARFNDQVSKLEESEPLPEDLRKEYARACEATIEEGIESMKQAIKRRADYDDAMAYLNLLYRRKADVATDEEERAELLKTADDLIDKVKEIKEARAGTAGRN
jgi:tetratricopeptide (TPR) repeat protein